MRQQQSDFQAQPTDEPLTMSQKQLLERAVAKIVVLGEQVGIGPDDMIALLQAGLSVRELLDYISDCRQAHA
jgi:hypothetical protein